ncbi:MAG: ubiquitin carboxyl-terminal hydrolase 4 [Lentinula lateritia]|nr:MAG: ubiquitin carboxyl-terminal hydrolase 4 [Lentinula lateritia]
MPISVLPTPPDFPPSKPPSKPTRGPVKTNYEPPNGSSAVDPTSSSSATESIALLKQEAQLSVQASAKGASAMALLHATRNQYLLATNCETQGDLKGAFIAFMKAASLAQMIFGTAEWSQNGQNALKRELKDFMEKDSNVWSRLKAVEAKLRMSEESMATSSLTSPSEGNSVSQKSGGSIADRKKALQNSGLSISTSNKRSSKDLHVNGTPISAAFSSANGVSPPSPNTSASSTISSTSASFGSSPASASTSSISASNSSIYSHAFVSPSTFGPPSPGSSPSSSPTLPTRSFSTSSEYNAFNAQFPSIDELDESDGRLDGSTPFTLPSVPTGRSTNSNRSVAPLASPVPATPGTPHAALRNFMVPVVERPSSTPSTPFRGSGSIWDSRPGSPTPTSTSKAPPVVPNKPSALSNSRSFYGNFDDPIPITGRTSPTSLDPSPSINGTSPLPSELYNYLREHKIILLDVRERAEFEKGHIELGKESKGVAWVCIEPDVLRRTDVTSHSIEDSLSLAPTSEASAFNNRHKFDLVVLYDRRSTSFSSTPPNPDMSTLLRAIWEREFRKTLRRMPMMLVGGYEAWVKEFGISESGMSSNGPAARTTTLVNGTLNGVATNGANSSSVPPPPMSPSILPQGLQGRNPFAPGGSLASPAISTPSATFSLQHPGSNGSRSRASTSPSRPGAAGMGHKVNHSVDKSATSGSSHSRALGESAPSNVSLSRSGRATPTFGPSTPLSPNSSGNGILAPTILNGATPITYPSISTYSLPSASSSSVTIRSPAPFDGMNGIASPPLPPQASINPSVSRRRTSDYIDQSQEALALSGMNTIDYPELSSTHPILRPPPAAAAGTLERQDSIKRFPTPPSSSTTGAGSTTPSYPSAEWPPRYWADSPIGTSGLKNMGNTCYMNAPIQCLSATVPFARFFTEVDLKTAINYMNKMNSQGQLTRAFSRLVHDIWHGDMPYITPNDFRRTLCSLNAQYIGTSQHDSQEFLSFLLDGIHEDTNRIMARKPITRTPEEEERLENLPQQIAGEYEWQVWRQSNDSIIVDFFQGMFRNQLRCMKCDKTSTTYNAFSILSLPVPARSGKIPLQNCLKAFFNLEVMEGDDAWDCPRCKTKRPATKTLSLARLPPVLVIHLKRFEVNGRFSDKIDTFVDFPVKGLDLTDLMPPPLPVGADQSLLNGGMVNGVMSRDDPRIQVGPYKYELYGVTNHYGNLSSGHYTAFVASRGGWLYCDDSSVKNVDAKQVVNQKAYVLFYKRVKA